MQEDEIVELDEILSELRGGAKQLAKDLIAGVEMVRLATFLLIIVGLLMSVFTAIYLFILPLYQGAPCCWVLTNYDLVGGLASIAGIVVSAWAAVRLRRKYASLRVRYRKLVELERPLED